MAEGPAGRVVLGDDGSPSADLAWAWITSHEWPGWQVEVVTARPRPGHVDPLAGEALQPSRARHLPGGDDPIVHERFVGKPYDAFVEFSDRDLLVVGPKGRGLRKALHLGSTAEALTARPPLPTVIARGGQPTRRALVASDGSAHVGAAVDALLAMPWIGSVAVAVVAVPEPGIDVDRACAGMAARIGDQPASVHWEVLVPDPIQIAYHPRGMLLDALEAWEADLLVMGARGLLSERGAGSIARALSQHARCSVLVAQAG